MTSHFVLIKFGDVSKANNNSFLLVKPEVENSDTYKVVEKTWITTNVCRIKFKAPGASINRIYSGLEMCGRSYSVTSMTNHVTRYYTICNSMGSLIYDEYLKALDAALEGKQYERKYERISDFNKEDSETLELVMKHYSMSSRGISTQAISAYHFHEFYLQGPLGAGFDYTSQNLQGTNLIFCGGTGILPFMDLFAYLGRKFLAENSPENSLFSDEKFEPMPHKPRFIIYAFFMTRDECIGVDIVEKIEKLYQQYDQGEFFKLNLVIITQGGQHLSDDEIIELIKDYNMIDGPLNRFLVCGPPGMNNQFQKLSPRIADETDCDAHTLEIL